MGCRELKDRMLLGSTLVVALVDKTRLAGHAGVAAGHKAVSLGMSVRMMIAPGYTGELPTIVPYLCYVACKGVYSPFPLQEHKKLPELSRQAENVKALSFMLGMQGITSLCAGMTQRRIAS